MTIKLEFDSVEELEKFKGQDSQRDKTLLAVQNVGHFLQNIAPDYKHILYEVGTFVVLNREEFLTPSAWENLRKRARETLGLKEKFSVFPENPVILKK